MTDGGSTDGQSLSSEASEHWTTAAALPTPAAPMAAAGAHMADQMERLQHDMDKVKRVAEGKGFAVDENTGDAIIKAIESYRKRWDSNLQEFVALTDGIELGSDPYANVVSKFHGSKASEALQKLRVFERTLASLENAIKTAKKNYDEMEDRTTLQFKSDENA